jgi:hypothetical protein
MSTHRSAARWIIGALGALAIGMGAFGAFNPEGQAHLMGFSSIVARTSGDHTIELLVITSLAAINTGILYVVGAVMKWSGFDVWAMIARLIMGSGLLALALSGMAPQAFIGAAAWEWIGAVLIGISKRWDGFNRSAHA